MTEFDLLFEKEASRRGFCTFKDRHGFYASLPTQEAYERLRAAQDAIELPDLIRRLIKKVNDIDCSCGGSHDPGAAGWGVGSPM